MGLAIDRRTRSDGDVVAELAPDRFFDEMFPGLAEAHGHLAAAGIRTLDARPLSMEVDGRTWTVVADSSGDTIDVVRYRPDDGRSWWATLTDGTERCVRLQHFVDHSPATADLLTSAAWDRVRRTLAGDDELVQGPVTGNCVEALVKPLGVVKGISDTPWHRGCDFGRHAYRCCSTTVGIAMSDGGETSGQLQAVAGSAQALSRLRESVHRIQSQPPSPLAAG